MMRVLAWKEFREQRAIWIAVAGLAVLLMIALIQLLDPAGTVPAHSEKAAILGVIAVSLAWIYGLVCGSMMLAGDKEASTQEFLDFLTARRMRLWWPKVLTGFALIVAQELFLAALILALGISSVWDGPTFLLAVCGLMSFVYGILGSACCRSVLASVGAAIAFSLVLPAIAFLVLLVAWKIAIPKSWLSDDAAMSLMGIMCFVIAPIVGLAGSGIVYCRPDYGRVRRRLRPGTPAKMPFLSLGWRTLLWLCWRQGRKEALALALAGLVIGLALPPQAIPFSVWPLATLAMGVWCGTAVFAKEQGGGYHRFLGAQRLPPGRVWLAKTLFWFAVAVVGALSILLGEAIHLLFADERQQQVWRHLNGDNGWLMDLMGPWLFGSVWLINGFCFGQFFALVWRKTVVAVVITIGAALGVAWLWFPSLVSGGLHGWQVWAVPVLLLAATRLAMWSWVSERLYTMKPLLLLAASGLLAVAWLLGNLWYRVAEVPDVGEPFDVKAFVAGLPKPEENQARKAITDALVAFQMHEKEVTQKLGPPKPPPSSGDKDTLEVMQRNMRKLLLGPAKPTAPPPKLEAKVEPGPADAGEPPGEEIRMEQTSGGILLPNPTYYDLIEKVLEKGWSEENPDLTKWIDRMFEGEWVKQAQEAIALPPGALIDPRTANFLTQTEVPGQCRSVAMIFVARALQMQSKGDDQSALDHLLLALRLSRHLRSHALPLLELSGRGVERLALRGIDRWLDRLGRKPELVRRALDELTKHEAALPSPTEPVKAQYLLIRNALDDPKMLDFMTLRQTQRQEEWSGQADVLRLAGKVPWERARLLRMVNVMFAGWLRADEADYADQAGMLAKDEHRTIGSEDWTWILGDWLPPVTSSGSEVTPEAMGRFIGQSWLRNGPYRGRRGFAPGYTINLCLLRATRLKLALALYQFEFGKAAPDLAALQRYIRPLPHDPFSGKSFLYRVSEGEEIQVSGSPDEEAKKVSAGQGILWSVGLDTINDGGTRAGSLDQPASVWRSGQLDLIFVVPNAKEK